MNNACSSRLTAAAGTGLAGTNWRLPSLSSSLTGFYDSRRPQPCDYRDQASAHSPQFPTAAIGWALSQSQGGGSSSQTR